MAYLIRKWPCRKKEETIFQVEILLANQKTPKNPHRLKRKYNSKNYYFKGSKILKSLLFMKRSWNKADQWIGEWREEWICRRRKINYMMKTSN